MNIPEQKNSSSIETASFSKKNQDIANSGDSKDHKSPEDRSPRDRKDRKEHKNNTSKNSNENSNSIENSYSPSRSLPDCGSDNKLLVLSII